MTSRLSVFKPRQTATKRMVLCCGLAGISFFAFVGFGPIERTQAAENTLPARQLPAAPTKNQPKLVASYGKLPLGFEIPDLSQLVPDPNAGKGALRSDPSSPCPTRKTHPDSTRLREEPQGRRAGPAPPRSGQSPRALRVHC